MDNLCHTLVGAALARTGLERRTPLAGATLIIGANFPDVDVVAVPLGVAFEVRRGWTHGILALVVLPVLLTGLVLLWDRLVRRRWGRGERAPARPGALLGLAALAILTHPVLDWMNTYGVRWLMPFDDRWYYGDALFIVDPWILLALGAAILAGLRSAPRRRERAARMGLALVGVYIGVMLAATALARRAVAGEMAANGWEPRLMAGPVPIRPLRRSVVVDAGDHYRTGVVVWTPSPRFAPDERIIPKNLDDPHAMRAARTREARAVLGWARFPFYVIERRGGTTVVRLDDARYSDGRARSWAAVDIVLAPSP